MCAGSTHYGGLIGICSVFCFGFVNKQLSRCQFSGRGGQTPGAALLAAGPLGKSRGCVDGLIVPPPLNCASDTSLAKLGAAVTRTWLFPIFGDRGFVWRLDSRRQRTVGISVSAAEWNFFLIESFSSKITDLKLRHGRRRKTWHPDGTSSCWNSVELIMILVFN